MSGHTFIKTFDRYADDAAPPTGTPAASGIWALRITRFDSGAKIGFAEDNLRLVYTLGHYRRRPGKGIEPFEVYVFGNIAFEYVTDPHDFDIFDGSLSPANSYDLTATNGIDSGPIAIAVGVNPTPVAGPSSTRVRGVTVQNVGTVPIAIGKSAALRQDLTAAAIILAPGAAANDGNGDAVTFDGWLGGVWAVNVAGGPGSVLVTAF